MSVQSLKSGWQIVKFGDVVRQCKESVDRHNNPFERYVEGGHMDSENIHIRRWGEFGADYVGPAFYRVFRKGQVLYGSRRTYLKKVAIAEFDGITANTTFICETKNPKVFMQELLPFLMLTDSFTAHSIRESKGSTNPYINWPDIAKYEFLLSPIEEQKRIAEILWAVDEVIERNDILLSALQTNYEVAATELYKGGRSTEKRINTKLWGIPISWSVKSLGDIASPQAPIRYGIVQVGDDTEGGVPTLAIKDLTGNFRDGLHRTNKKKEAQYRNSRVRSGDVLLAIKATVGDVAEVPEGFEGNISRDLARIRLGTEMIPGFLVHLIRTKIYQRYLNKYVVGSTRKELSIHVLRSLPVPVPSIEEQYHIVSLLAEMESKMMYVCDNLRKSRCLLRALLDTTLYHKRREMQHV